MSPIKPHARVEVWTCSRWLSKPTVEMICSFDRKKNTFCFSCFLYLYLYSACTSMWHSNKWMDKVWPCYKVQLGLKIFPLHLWKFYSTINSMSKQFRRACECLFLSQGAAECWRLWCFAVRRIASLPVTLFAFCGTFCSSWIIKKSLKFFLISNTFLQS